MGFDANAPLQTEAYVCNAKGEDLVLQEIVLPPLNATMVELDITHCGLCHTDIHMRDNDWGISNFPVSTYHVTSGIFSNHVQILCT
jgi:alcohol/geraniol dehydrogenase (NADP+)